MRRNSGKGRRKDASTHAWLTHCPGGATKKCARLLPVTVVWIARALCRKTGILVILLVAALHLMPSSIAYNVTTYNQWKCLSIGAPSSVVALLLWSHAVTWHNLILIGWHISKKRLIPIPKFGFTHQTVQLWEFWQTDTQDWFYTLDCWRWREQFVRLCEIEQN